MIAERYAKIYEQLPEDVTLCVVSKNHTVEEIWEVYNAGARDFGENRVQELMSKVDLLPKDIRWHLIGSLQRNKVKYIAPFIESIQSVDSVELYQEILKRVAKAERSVDILLEVHVAQEKSKGGLPLEAIEPFLKDWTQRVEEHKTIRIRGLMTMATNTGEEEAVRREFQEVKQLFDHLKEGVMKDFPYFDTLSMGMSGDWTLAVEEGSTMVRVGTAIMGERSY